MSTTLEAVQENMTHLLEILSETGEQTANDRPLAVLALSLRSVAKEVADLKAQLNSE